MYRRFDSASSSTPIWLDGFSCSQFDDTLNDCTITSGVGVHNCAHNEDVAVFCLGSEFTPSVYTIHVRMCVFVISYMCKINRVFS